MRAILTYHSIDDSGSVISVAPATFESHVRWMASGRVRVVGLAELLTLPDDSDAVAVTFDDAFVNFAAEAWPRLKHYGLPVTLFVPTGVDGGSNDWAALPGGSMPRLPILDWGALARLQEEGATLGAHSRSHPDLRQLDGAALDDEVLGSVEDIRRETGRRPESFAYPYGHWNARAALSVRRACAHACTTALQPLSVGDDPLLLPRLDAFYLEGPARLEQFGRPAFRRYIRVRSTVRALGTWVRAKLR